MALPSCLSATSSSRISLKDPLLMRKHATAGRLYISGWQMVSLHNPDFTSECNVASQYSIVYHVKVNKTTDDTK